MTSRSRTRLSVCIGTLCLCLFTGVAASAVTTAPERAVREFIRALAMHDTQAFSRAIRPDPRASRFINPQPLTPDGQVEAARRLETLQVRRSDDVLLRGKPVDADAQGDYPVGSVGHFIASGNGGPAVVTLVRDPDGWKVDLRWWLAMLDMANGRPPAEGSPDHAIRSLTLALIALDRDEALRFVAPGTDISVLFAGAPSVREPSGYWKQPQWRCRSSRLAPASSTACHPGASSRAPRLSIERSSSGNSDLSRCRSCCDASVAYGASRRSRTSR